MSEKISKITENSFRAMVCSFSTGMIRLWSSRVSQLSLELALTQFNKHKSSMTPQEIEGNPAIKELGVISVDDFDAWRYIGDFSHLVYSASLFDTFLSDVTRFMFYLFPGLLGKDEVATVDDVLKVKTTSELIGVIVDKKVKEISYQSFIERVFYLKRSLKLNIKISPVEKERLIHYSGVRNAVIHDQGFIDFFLVGPGEVKLIQKSCHKHPNLVSRDEIKLAIGSYARVACALSCSIFSDILYSEPPEIIKVLKGYAIGDESPIIVAK